MIKRRHLIGHLAAAPFLASLPTMAQSYPDKPIKIIVPLPPGSPPDVLARHLADAVSRTGTSLGTLVIGSAGRHSFQIRPKRKPGVAVMDVRQVILRPIPGPATPSRP